MNVDSDAADKSLKILIVDDSAAVLERLSESISEIGRTLLVGKAKDVPEAMSIFDSLQPDVMILDIQMPGGSGLDVLRHAKKIRPGVVVFVMTSFPFPHYREVAMRDGAEYFLDKSTALPKIKEVIEELIAGFERLTRRPGAVTG